MVISNFVSRNTDFIEYRKVTLTYMQILLAFHTSSLIQFNLVEEFV